MGGVPRVGVKTRDFLKWAVFGSIEFKSVQRGANLRVSIHAGLSHVDSEGRNGHFVTSFCEKDD